MTTALRIAVCLTAMASAGLTSQEPPATPKGEAGVLVKFKAESAPAAMVERAAATSDKPTDELSRHVAALGRELGLPLEVKRLASGGAVLVTVSNAALPEAIAGKLEGQRTVKSARPLPPKNRADTAAVVVQFTDGSSAAAAVRAASSDVERRTAASRIAVDLSRATGLALTAGINEDGQLLVTPSLAELSAQIASRLAKRSDVEYAQPNFLVHRDAAVK